MQKKKKIIKPDLEMSDLEDHDSRAEYLEKGGHDRNLTEFFEHVTYLETIAM